MVRRFPQASSVTAVVLGTAGLALMGIFANEAGTISGRPIQVDMTGGYSGPGGPTGILAVLATIAGFGWVLIVLFWPAFVARQVIAWRRSTGERRQQLKWLMGGAIIAVAGLMAVAFGPSIDQTPGQVLRDLALVALAALPVSIGIGILKYRLYDIDRLISRMLSYVLLSGLLIGVYLAMITLAARVPPVKGLVAVAAFTLVAAVLFNPLRRRVQHRRQLVRDDRPAGVGGRAYDVSLSRRCRRSWAASSTSLCRHSAARYMQAMMPIRWMRRKSP
jgi:NADH:ubiquinone oxidoreductase subunit K